MKNWYCATLMGTGSSQKALKGSNAETRVVVGRKREHYPPSLLLGRRSIDLSGARENEGHFQHENFLRASKLGITPHTCSIIPKSLYWGLGLSLIHSKGILGGWSRYGMWYLISKLSKSFFNESDLLFLVHHWGRLTSDLRGVSVFMDQFWDELFPLLNLFGAKIYT